jgi:hypothetical protein
LYELSDKCMYSSLLMLHRNVNVLHCAHIRYIMFTSHFQLFNLGTSDQEDCIFNLHLVT